MTGPRRAPDPARPTPLHGRDGTRQIEQALAAALPSFTLMGRAGRSLARLVQAVAPHAARCWVAAGPGNNGGDGLEAAVHLQAAGMAVQVTLAAEPDRLPCDARTAYGRAVAAGVKIVRTLPEPLDAADVAIDAVLGVGATRPPAGELAHLVRRLNGHAGRVVAVDLPSGLDADTGLCFGADAVRATHTLALLTLKPGLFTADGRDHAGQVWFDALGEDAGATPPSAWLPAAPCRAARRHAQHKGSFGDVLVVGGDRGMAGAALLAARAAHAAGAGRVHVDLLDATAAVDFGRPELMLRPSGRRAAWPPHATVVAGCGGGAAIAQRLPELLHGAERLVLDADALNAVARDVSLASRLAARRRHGRDTVLTPHPLEAARLLGTDTATVQRDRVASARTLADRFQAVVVLKGSGSILAAPDSVPFVNPTGNAALATAGTGDVLAGWLGGLWAASGDAWQAALHATWQHGEAADRSLVTPLRAADLVDALHGLSRR